MPEAGAGAPRHYSDAKHPYSTLRRHGGLIFVAGQLGQKDGAIVDGGIVPETRQAFANLRGLLAAEGLGLDSVLKVTVYLASLADRLAMDDVYLDEFGDVLPARTCLGAGELPFGARVELDVIAAAASGP